MANIYDEFRQKVGSMIIIIWPMALIGVFLSGWIIFQDLKSTVYAYDLLPTQKPDQTLFSPTSGATGMIVDGMQGTDFSTGSKTAWVIGFLLLVTQIVMFYMYTVDTTKVWARAIAVICLFFDTGTDVFFKMYGEWNFVMFLFAVVETLLVYTVVSEFLFTIFLGFVIQTAGHFFVVVGEAVNNMIDAAFEFAGQETERFSGGDARARGGTNTGQRNKYKGGKGRPNRSRKGGGGHDQEMLDAFMKGGGD